MRSPRVTRRGALAMGAALAVTLAAAACGRIGYGLLPGQDRAGPSDASTDRKGPAPVADATEDTTAADGGVEAEGGDTPDAPVDASADSSADEGIEAEAGCPDGAPADYCSGLPAMASAPVIDGVLDLSPCTLVDMTPEFWSGPPPLPPFPPGNTTQIAAAWRPDGLYVFLAVTTPADFPAEAGTPVFYGAGVELFVDNDGVYTSPPSYDDPGTIQIIVTAPTTDAGVTQRAEEFRNAADEGPWASTRYGTFPTATGFVFEGLVTAADLGLASWSLAAGATIGFDVAIDVSFTTESMTGPQGHRVGQYFFHVADADSGIGSPFADPRSFCTPTLADR
jgi:hypothetical protein